MQKKCKVCNKQYITTNKESKYCSRECYFNSKMSGQYVKCKVCNKEFYRHKKRRQKYCSYNCANKRRKKIGSYVKCQICKKSFYLFPSKIKLNNEYYCSKKCWYSILGEKQKNNPEGLKGLEKARKLRKYKPLSEAHKKKISIQSRKNARYGKNNLWQGGISKLQNSIRNCYKYKQWIKAVFERDDYTCQDCNAVGKNLNAHHNLKKLSKIVKDNNIKNIDDALKCDELWDVDNGQTLCFNCHCKYHKSLKHFILIK